jgi:hypothetical protein
MRIIERHQQRSDVGAGVHHVVPITKWQRRCIARRKELRWADS